MAAILTEAAISALIEGITDAGEIKKLEKNIKKIKNSYKKNLATKKQKNFSMASLAIAGLVTLMCLICPG